MAGTYRTLAVVAVSVAGLAAGLAIGPRPAHSQPFILCLYIPIFGAKDPHSTCLTRPQMARRAAVMQCEDKQGKPGLASRRIELAYIITGDKADLSGLWPGRVECIGEREKSILTTGR